MDLPEARYVGGDDVVRLLMPIEHAKKLLRLLERVRDPYLEAKELAEIQEELDVLINA